MIEHATTASLVALFGALVISITLHEAMHAFTSHWLGDDTASLEGRISLNPLRHIDPVLTILLPLVSVFLLGIPLLAAKPVPFNPYRVKFEEFGAALVGLAGPLTNLMLAIFGAAILHIIGFASIGLYNAILIFVQINIALFVFNMIPIPPLDGSRVLYAFAPESMQRFMAQMEQYGFYIVFGLVLLVPSFMDLIISINKSILRLLV